MQLTKPIEYDFADKKRRLYFGMYEMMMAQAELNRIRGNDESILNVMQRELVPTFTVDGIPPPDLCLVLFWASLQQSEPGISLSAASNLAHISEIFAITGRLTVAMVLSKNTDEDAEEESAAVPLDQSNGTGSGHSPG
jgi:hypothetical protein